MRTVVFLNIRSYGVKIALDKMREIAKDEKIISATRK